MFSIDWDLTVDTILAGKCILFMGPEVFTNSKGEKLEQRMLKYLAVDADPDVKVYGDGLFFFRVKQKRTETYLKIRRFFQEENFPEGDALFEKIARIPFHFILAVTPDNRLEDTFARMQLPFKADFYWKKHPADHKAPLPTIQQPLLYDILGNISRPESLVLTHDDLFDYLESIFQPHSMSDTLKDHIINEAQSIIFLGIPFDRWYMQLLLRVLHLHKDEEFMRFAVSQELTEEIQTLCKDQFKINFVTHHAAGFIDEIYRRCEANGRLRQLNVKQQTAVQSLKQLVAEDRINDALERGSQWLSALGAPAGELLDDVALLTSRYKRLNRKITQGVVSNEEAGLEINKIRSALLDVVNEAKVFE